MKAVLLATQPKWCELEASGKKTVEIRKGKPKLETPFKCYIYCSAGTSLCVIGGRSTGKRIRPLSIIGNRKVIGEFVCDCIDKLTPDYNPIRKEYFYNNDWGNHDWNSDDYCLTDTELLAYGKGKTLYGWHISELKIYDKPKELSEFRRPCDRFLDCFLCRRHIRDAFGGCDSKIHRAPQSYMFVEELP